MKAFLIISVAFVLFTGGISVEERHYVLVKEHTSSVDKRSHIAPLPAELTVSFKSKDDHVTLRLRRNLDINHNAPVVFTDGSTADESADIQNVGVYQDVDKRASISVTAHLLDGKHVRSLEGSFVHDGKYYLIEPTEGVIEEFVIALVRKRSLGDMAVVPHILTEKRMHVPGSAETRGQIDYKLHTKTKNGPKIIKVKVPRYKVESRQKQDTEDGVNDDVVARLLDLLKKSSRVRRDTTVFVYSVELLLLLDHTIWERNMELAENNESEAMKRLKYYYSHIINGMDLAYSSIDPIKHGFTIDIFLKGYVIAKTRPESNWTVPFLLGNTTDSNYREVGVNGSLVLDYLAEWHVSDNRTWYNPDHAMLFTRYNIDKSETIGLATQGAICTKSGNSIVEDIGFHSWYTAAHELGHSLGAGHDGQDNSCNSSSMHIMTPSIGTVENENIHNVYTFSECSITEMKINIRPTGSDDEYLPRVCLHNKLCTHVDLSPDISTLPGQRHSADQQCQALFGLNSSTCDTWQEDGELCLVLGCKDNNGYCTQWSPGAADGTPCATDKWCYHGQCVARTTIQSGTSGTSCKTTTLAVTPPAGCADTNGFTTTVGQLDGSQTIESCSGITEKNPEFCFLSDNVAEHCCVSCHKFGLVKGAFPEAATPTTAAINAVKSSTTTEPSKTTRSGIVISTAGCVDTSYKTVVASMIISIKLTEMLFS